MGELDVAKLRRQLTRLHHSARGTGEGEDWYQVPVSLMNVALAVLDDNARLRQNDASMQEALAESDRLLLQVVQERNDLRDRCERQMEQLARAQLVEEAAQRIVSGETDSAREWLGILRAALAEEPGDHRPPTGTALIAAERRRQVAEEGWTPQHDDGHGKGELAQAAMAYLYAGQVAKSGSMADWFGDPRTGHLNPPASPYLRWPWPDAWKPSDDPIRNFVRAAALIAAEIDRLQRADASAEEGGRG